MVELKDKPFYLSDEDVRWVETTLAGMSLEEKIAQLFCLIIRSSEQDYLDDLVHQVKPGGLMFRHMPASEAVQVARFLQDNSRIPLLLAANFEKGGDGLAMEGTSLGAPMQGAAAGGVRV